MIRAILFCIFICGICALSCNRQSTSDKTQEPPLREQLTVLNPKGDECRVDTLNKFDRCRVEDVSIEKGNLAVKLVYSGGCKNHCFKVTWDGQLEEESNEVILNLLHDSNNDKCEAMLNKTRLFELSSLKDGILAQYEVSRVNLVLKYGDVKAEGVPWQF